MTTTTLDSQKTTEYEAEIAALRRQLQESQRLASLGELVGTTTHEFNNILMTVINYAKMGLRHKDQPTREKAFQRILTAGEKAAKITNMILGVAKNRSDTFEPIDLSKLVSDALVLLERELSKYRVRVDFQADDVPAVLANGNQIQQVILNLLINARQAMPDGGEVTIRISRDVKDQSVALLIRDSGCGIPQDKLPNIFDAYYSTKSGPDETGKGGTGLGLNACREIIKSHNGRILVQSTVGRGTAFTVRLPIAKDSS